MAGDGVRGARAAARSAALNLIFKVCCARSLLASIDAILIHQL